MAGADVAVGERNLILNLSDSLTVFNFNGKHHGSEFDKRLGNEEKVSSTIPVSCQFRYHQKNL